jgi:CHAD domain-containing protein
MAYRLKSEKLTGKTLRKVSVEQTARALESLSKQSVLPEDVHEARKAVKRVRSLLKLLEPELPADTFRARYKGIGKAGDHLAGARDRHVLDVTLDKLVLRFGKDFKPVATAMQAMLDAAAPVEQPSRLADDELEQAKRVFAQEARLLAKLEVPGKGFDLIAAGLEETYRTAKKNFAAAYRRPSDERFHEMRKAVQWHWRHMALLSRCWPEYFALRVGACRELAEALGDDHDLAVLIEVADRQGDVALRAKLEVAARRRQKELRKQAYALAERLFAETPRAFRLRMACYWAAKGKLAVNAAHDPADRT